MFEILSGNGVTVRKNVSSVVDPQKLNGNELSFITHGHSDHVNVHKSSDSEYILTPETFSLIENHFTEKNKVRKLNLNKKIELDDYSFELRNAGHILGSAQVLFESSQRVVVSGDLKLQDSILFKGAEIVESDVLIIESTFGLPEFVFPEREIVYEEIGNFVKENVKKKNFVVLGGYSLGKAQELNKIVNEYAGEVPLVYEKVFEFNEVYKKHGIDLGEYIKLDHNLNEGNVLIMPPHLLDGQLLSYLNHLTKKSVVSGIASGWNRAGMHKSFLLSDHADFNQLMEYIQLSGPKMVLTYHGFEKELANFISRRLNIPAKPLSKNFQKNLLEYA